MPRSEVAQSFKARMTAAQIRWRRRNASTQERGEQHGQRHRHVLPAAAWEETIWPGIRERLRQYIETERIKPHTDVSNLVSSWAACANLYFPFGERAEDLALVA